jgi:transposase
MILRKIKIKISDADREKLNNVLKSSKSEYRMIERARIITHLEEEPDVEKVAEKLNISSKSVRKWRRRFYLEGFEGLLERQRPGRPPEYTLQEKMEITAIACDSPKNYGYETANSWTYEMLEEVSIREGINMRKTVIYETLKKMNFDQTNSECGCIARIRNSKKR